MANRFLLSQKTSPKKMTNFLRLVSLFMVSGQVLVAGILSLSHYHSRVNGLDDRLELLTRFLGQTAIPPHLKISDANLDYLVAPTVNSPSPLYAVVSDDQEIMVASFLQLNDPTLLNLRTNAQKKHKQIANIIQDLEERGNIIKLRRPILTAGKFLGVLTIGYSRTQMVMESFAYGLKVLLLCLIVDILLVLLYSYYFKQVVQAELETPIKKVEVLPSPALPNTVSALVSADVDEFSSPTQLLDALQPSLGKLINQLQTLPGHYHSPVALANAQQEALFYLIQVLESLLTAQQNTSFFVPTVPDPALLSPYLEKMQQEKNEFLAMIGHEMRTPLNAVTGMTRLLLDTPLSSQQQEFVHLIRNSGDTLLMMINNILDFSKIESGKLELEQHSFDLRQCIEDVLRLFVSQSADKPVELGYLIESQTPISIVGDITRLRQILTNLVGNALKFTQKGEVVVYVNSTLLSSPDSAEKENLDQTQPALSQYEIRFAVKDTGIGIPRDRLERLFKSFSQIDSSTTRKYGGTGLGLVISKRLCELMGGKIWVHSEENYGSTFYFTIIVEAIKSKANLNITQSIQELMGKRLLIINDNLTNQKILTQQTQSWGIFTCAVDSWEKALEWFQQGVHFDIAILDIGSSQHNFLDLIRQIRQQSGYHNLPILIINSITNFNDFEEIENLHYIRVLNKPIQQSELYKNLLHIVSEKPIKMTPAKPMPGEFSAPMHTLKILVAEDVTVNQAVIRLLLGKLGYQADIVSNGLEALKALHHQSYDVVLMDVRMPDMDGLSATHHIYQDIFPRPRIIAMTAEAMPGDKENCLAAGMDDYLSKPINIELLQQALARCVPLSVPESSEKTAPPSSLPTTSVPERTAVSVSPTPLKSATELINLSENLNVFDPKPLEVLAQMAGSRAHQVIHNLISSYLQESPQHLIVIAQVISSGEWDGLENAIKSLGSTSVRIGATNLGKLCKEIESRLQEKNLTEIAMLFNRLEQEYEQVVQILKRKQEQYQNEVVTF